MWRRVAGRWGLSFAALALILYAYHAWLPVNATTVALTLLLFILLVAARWTLRHAVVRSVAASLGYNYWFLPPEGALTIHDPQNWLALGAFLATSVVGSRLSQRARGEAAEAQARERELGVLFRLSRALLATDRGSELQRALPEVVREAAEARSALLFLLDGERTFHAGPAPAMDGLAELALRLSSPEVGADGAAAVPLRAGARPRGLLVLLGGRLSEESLPALGGLVSIALDRAQALEDAARSEALKKSEQLRTLVLDSITHELRTPLTSIRGAATALLYEPGAPEAERCELLAIIDEESDRLNRLLGQALEMAELQSHEVRMEFRPIAVSALLADAAEHCPGHPVEVELAPKLPAVRANLLENAAKYSPAGSPVRASAAKDGALVRFSVADRGAGIPLAEQELIFDRLYRSPAQAGLTSGTGMGLAISRAIVEAHGGVLSVASRPGHGATFSFTLPAA